MNLVNYFGKCSYFAIDKNILLYFMKILFMENDAQLKKILLEYVLTVNICHYQLVCSKTPV